jgi:hypothetical protein
MRSRRKLCVGLTKCITQLFRFFIIYIFLSLFLLILSLMAVSTSNFVQWSYVYYVGTVHCRDICWLRLNLNPKDALYNGKKVCFATGHRKKFFSHAMN